MAESRCMASEGDNECVCPPNGELQRSDVMGRVNSGKLVAKRGYRGCLVIPHIEDCVELRDLQYVVDLLGEMQ